MEFRRLIGFGKSSLVMSIPKQWINGNGLAKGDLVYLEVGPDRLEVSPRERKAVPAPRVAVISTDKKSLRGIESQVVSSYLNSADVYEIRGADLAGQGSRIKAMIQDLPGVEIVESDDSKIVAREVLDLDGLSVDALIRRIDLLLRSMLKDAAAPAHEDFLEGIGERDREVNRSVFLVKRMVLAALEHPSLARRLGRSNKALLLDWGMASLLEACGDEIKRLSRLFKQVDPARPRQKDLEGAIALLSQRFVDVMRAYHTKDVDLAIRIEEGHKPLMESIDAFTSGEADPRVHRAIHHMKSLSSDIKEVARIVAM